MRWRLIRSGAAAGAPKPRFDAITWYCNGALWLFSGTASIDGMELLSDLWRFDTASETWSEVPQTRGGGKALWPIGRSGAASWTGGSVLSMYGGALGSKLLDERWDFNVRLESWSKRGSSDPSPGARSGSVAWNDGDGRVWLFGGVGTDRNGCTRIVGDLWSYSDAIHSWRMERNEQHETLPPPLTNSSVCVTPQRCWLFDGLSPFAHDAASTDLWAFHKGTAIASDYSCARANIDGPCPSARVGTSIFSNEADRVYIFGGQTTGSTRSHLNDLWLFEVQSRKWTLLSAGEQSDQWPSPRSNSCSWTGEHGRTWLFGGYGGLLNGAPDALGDLWLYSA